MAGGEEHVVTYATANPPDFDALMAELQRLRFIEANALSLAAGWRKHVARYKADEGNAGMSGMNRAMRSCAEEVEEILTAAGPPSDYEATLATRVTGYIERLWTEAADAGTRGGDAESAGSNTDAARYFARCAALSEVAWRLGGLLGVQESPPTLESVLGQIERAATSLREIQAAMVREGTA